MRKLLRKIYRYLRSLFTGSRKMKDSLKENGVLSKLPSWALIAYSEMGVKEFSGKRKSNPEVEKYFAASGHEYTDDISWCAAFINYCFSQVGLEGTNQLNARSFLDWGQPIDIPRLGCVCVLWRENKESWKGHVFFYVGSDEEFVYALGGNQSDKVNIQKYHRDRVLGFRWPKNSLTLIS